MPVPPRQLAKLASVHGIMTPLAIGMKNSGSPVWAPVNNLLNNN
jgi:hypothetical protein